MAQDSIQVTRKLNLNFGLRYEYFGPLYSNNKDLAVFIPGQGMLIQGNGIDSVFPPDRNNFAPRFGFAFQPKADGDLVVRGGIGVFYDQINMNPFLDFRPPISAADGLQDNPVGPAAVSNLSLNGYNWDAVQAGGASVFPGVTLCPSLNFNTDPACGVPTRPTARILTTSYSVNQNFRAPYFFNYNLQVEKSLGSAAVFQIGYVGSEGRKLSTMLNINQLGADTDRPIQCSVPQRRLHPATQQRRYLELQFSAKHAEDPVLSRASLPVLLHLGACSGRDERVSRRHSTRQLQPEGGVRQRRFRHPAQLHHQPDLRDPGLIAWPARS